MVNNTPKTKPIVEMQPILKPCFKIKRGHWKTCRAKNAPYLGRTSPYPPFHWVPPRDCTLKWLLWHEFSCDLGTRAKIGHSFGLTTCDRPQLKLYYYCCFYGLGLRPISGADRRKLQPHLAPMPYQVTLLGKKPTANDIGTASLWYEFSCEF